MAKTLTDLLQALNDAIHAADDALRTADLVAPKGHRVDMVRSQVEAAKDTLQRAKGFCFAKQSGTFSVDELNTVPKGDSGE